MAEAIRNIEFGTSSYDTDFHAWTSEQARLLRAGRLGQADIEAIAGEIEDLGKRDRREIQSQLIRLIQHLLKLEFSSAAGPVDGWRDSVNQARVAIELGLEDSPSLRSLTRATALETAHVRAASLARGDLAKFDDLTPEIEAQLRTRRYAAPEVLGDWWPR